MHDTNSLVVPQGTMGGYFTLKETNDWVSSLVSNWPEVLKVMDIGSSFEKRGINALCIGISCNKDSYQDETPEVLYTALHHSREPLSLMNLIYFIADVMERYSNEEQGVLHLLQTRRLWFVLVVNPDGYEWNYRNFPNGKGEQRKNRHTECRVDAKVGVDLNRNYPFCFNRDNKGSSKNPCAEDYQGQAAFSEPETQAIRDFVESHHFSVAFNYHSFGHAIYIPYSCDIGEVDKTFISRFAKGLNDQNTKYSWGRPFLMGLYPVNGDASDWMYNSHSIMAVSPEVAPDDDRYVSVEKLFWPSKERIKSLSRENLGMNYRGARTAGSFLEVIDSSLDSSRITLSISIVNQGNKTTNGPVRAALCQGARCSHPETSLVSLVGSTSESEATWKVELPWNSTFTTLEVWDDTDRIVLPANPEEYKTSILGDSEATLAEGSRTTPLPIPSRGVASEPPQASSSLPTNGPKSRDESPSYYGVLIVGIVILLILRYLWKKFKFCRSRLQGDRDEEQLPLNEMTEV